MDLDDSFTEGLIQRAHARREFIKKKSEFVSAGKKRSVLTDENQVNSDEPPNKSPKCHSAQSAYSPQNKENADKNVDSPDLSVPKARGLTALKQNFLGNEPLNKLHKCPLAQNEDSNTPSVPVLSASRIRGLAALKNNYRGGEDEDTASEFEVNKSNTYVYSTNSRELCIGQRSRLANIAANIRLWEDDTRRPTLASKNAALSTNISNSNNYPISGQHLSNVSVQSEGGVGSPKQGNVGVVSVGSRHKKLRVWDEAIMAALDGTTPTSPVKNGTKTCDGSTKELENDKEYSDESINEDDFAENYGDIKSDHDCNTKMGLGYSPVKQTKGGLQEQNFEPVKSLPPQAAKDFVDPAELPLSARKALFEKALMSGTTKVKKDITEHTLSVAERAAMFENAFKGSSGPKRAKAQGAHFMDPKTAARTDLSKYSPVKTAQPVYKANLHITEAPPITSVPFPSKHVGNYTCSIQQELMKKSDAIERREEESNQGAHKQEVSNMVHRWEKLSSSSSTEEKKDLASEEPALNHSDAVEETSEEDEPEGVVSEEEEADDAVSDDEQRDDCAKEFSPATENVFFPPDAEQGSAKAAEDEVNSCETQKISPTSSQNTGSLMSSLSCSGVSSCTDDSSYCPSGSQSCTSDSSVRSYDVNEERKEKNPETPLLYTVSFYRKQKQETRLTPVQTIVRNRKEERSPASPDTLESTEHIQERVKALQEEVLRQQTVISQTSQALNLCSATTEFSGSMEQVEGERLLLISTQKRQALLNEITRLKAFGTQGESVMDGKGTLTITDLQLPLKREFITSQLEGKGTDTVHYFLCLIRHGAQVIVTQMMSSDDKTSDGALCFTNHIQLQNLPADFSVIFEVYALQTKKEVLSHEKKYHIKREHSKIRLTPKGKKADGKILLPAVSSPGGPNAVRSPSFGVVGYTRFTLLNCNRDTFTLEKVPFTSPLEGILRVRLQLHAENRVLEKGFLTMFEDVSGFGAWHRRWCALDTSQLSYWKYPDDEHKKEPVGMIDLRQCITSQVKVAPREVCARPHTLELMTVRPQEKGDKNTLISSSVNTLTKTRHLLSADTKEERILWCNKLNEALTSVRKWDPRILKLHTTEQKL